MCGGRCKVASVREFASGLRRFAELLESDPETASMDAGADLFVAATSLMYDGGFLKELGQATRERAEAGEVVAEGVHCMTAFLVFCEAAAEYGCGGSESEAKESGPFGNAV